MIWIVMAIIAAGSAATGDTGEFNATSGTPPTVGADAGSGSGFSIRCNSVTTAVRYVEVYKQGANGRPTTAINLADSWHEAYFKVDTAPASDSEEICRVVTSSGTLKMSVRITSARKLQVYSTSNAQLGSDGATALSLSTWYRIGVMSGTGASASYVLKIDGVDELTGTGDLNTTNAGGIRWGKAVNQNSQTTDFYYRDYYTSDTGFIGTAYQGAALVPTGNGNYTDWNGTYEDVDDRPHDSGTTVVTSTAVNQVETVALTNAADASITGTIHGVRTHHYVSRAGASNGSIAIRTRSGSTDSDTGTNFTTTSSYLELGQLHLTDPATGSAWLTSGIDGLETGCVNKNGVNNSVCTLMMAYVMFTPAAAGTGNPWYAYRQQ